MVPLQENRKLDTHSGGESAGDRAGKTKHSALVAEREKQAAYFAAEGQIGNITDDYERPPQRSHFE